MGYRNPGFDQDEESTQFEWDGERQSWLFCRNGSHAPVRVSEAEKDRCEAIQKQGGFVVLAIFVAVLLFAEDRFESLYTTHDAKQLARLTAFGAGITIYIFGMRLVDRLATRPFRNRRPAGPERPRADDQPVQFRPHGWMAPAAFVAFGGFLAWVHVPPTGLADAIWLGLAAIIAAMGLAGIWSERRPRLL